MMSILPCLFAAIAVASPDGPSVCRVTPPTCGAGVVVETTNLTGGVAWRIRYDGTAPRTVANEEWTFDFGGDFKCWPVSHAQGEYIPLTLSTIAHERHPNYSRSCPGSCEGPLVVEGNGWVAALGEAGNLDYSRIRFASGAQKGQVKTVLEGAATVAPPYVTPWRYVRVAKDCVELANGQPAFMDALNAPSRIADTSWIKPGKVLRVAKLSEESGKACVDFVLRNNFQYIEMPKRVEVRGLSGKVRRTVFTGPHRDAHNSPFEPEALKESVSDFPLPGTDILPPLSLVIYH